MIDTYALRLSLRRGEHLDHVARTEGDTYTLPTRRCFLWADDAETMGVLDVRAGDADQWWQQSAPWMSLTTRGYPRSLSPAIARLAAAILAELRACPIPVFPGRALRRLMLGEVGPGSADDEITALLALERQGLIERTTNPDGLPLRRYWPAPYAYRLARGER